MGTVLLRIAKTDVDRPRAFEVWMGREKGKVEHNGTSGTEQEAR
jgi:hypothetical protein